MLLMLFGLLILGIAIEHKISSDEAYDSWKLRQAKQARKDAEQ